MNLLSVRTTQLLYKMQPPRNIRTIQCGRHQKKLSRSILAFFAYAEFCFGFRFGFVNVASQRFETTIRFVSSKASCVLASFLLIPFVFEVLDVWMIAYFVQYIPSIFILVSTKYTLGEFLTDKRTTSNF